MLLKHNFLLFYIFLKQKTKWGSGFGHFPLYIKYRTANLQMYFIYLVNKYPY
jgi:hypothetical protein